MAVVTQTSQEKTEEATPRQLQKAREKGDVSVSRDLNSAVLLAAAAVWLGWSLGALGDVFERVARRCAGTAIAADFSAERLVGTLLDAANDAAIAVLPLLVILTVAGALTNFLQIGPVLSFDPLLPKLERLDPAAGLKRVFFSSQSWIELFKSIAKIVALGLICSTIVRAEIPRIVRLADLPLTASARVAVEVVGSLVAWAVLFFGAVAVLDVLLQRWQYRKKLRMSKQQVKEEYKESEGDPRHKSARQRAHEEILSNTMMIAAHRADATIVNPTHIACSIRYRPREGEAPRLIAKGRGVIAAELRRISKDEGIEVTRNVSLARALFELEIDQQIPEELYDAVAEVLRWVERVARFRGEEAPWVVERRELDSERDRDDASR